MALCLVFNKTLSYVKVIVESRFYVQLLLFDACWSILASDDLQLAHLTQVTRAIIHGTPSDVILK